MVIGLFFDMFRILRKTFHTPDIVTYIEDVIFWLLTGLFLLFVLFQCNNGEIRIYHIVGLILGGIFYMLSISKFFVKISVSILTVIKGIVYKGITILLSPMKLLFRFLRKLWIPLPIFVINFQKMLFHSDKKVENKQKRKKKSEKVPLQRRILKRNVEKYN